MAKLDDLINNSVLGSNGRYLVGSKKKEDAIRASKQIWDGGLVIVVSYAGTNYVKITDGAHNFAQLASEGGAITITSNEISDATSIGKAVLTAADAAAARTAIGAGTSNLVLGTTEGTALAGNTTFPTPNLSQVVAIGSDLPINSSIFFKDLDGTNNIGILRTSGTNTFALFGNTGKTIVINPTNGEVRMVGSGGSGDTSTLSIELKLGVLPAGNNTPITDAMTWNQGVANLQAQVTALVGATLTGSSPALTFDPVPANGELDLGFNITGAAIGDCVALGIPGAVQAQNGVVFSAMVSNTNVITVRCTNVTASPISLPAGVFKATVFK